MKTKSVVVIAYDLNPAIGSECRQAYIWIKILAKYFNIHAFVCAAHLDDLSKEHIDNIKFTFIKVPLYLRSFAAKTGAYNLPISNFMGKVERELKDKQLAECAFIHCLTPAGIYSYNQLYKIGLPVLVGPIGGALSVPKGFERIFAGSKLKSIFRDVFYKIEISKKGWRDYFINATKVIVGTDYVRSLLPIEAQKRCEIIFDAVVDPAYWTPPEQRSVSENVRILYAARLESQKGIILLLEAAKLCIEAGVKKFQILVAGAGPLESKIISLIKKFDLGLHVNLLGKLSTQEMKIQYQQADIFCLPTLREPGGNAILEAMASGLPVITSNYGGPKYSVTDDCGIKIEVSNYEQYMQDLADAIGRLVTDETLRKKMGENARKRIIHGYSPDVLEGKILKVYNEVLNEK